MRLTQAYRSLPRPSSASRTELSTTQHGSDPVSGTSLNCSTVKEDLDHKDNQVSVSVTRLSQKQILVIAVVIQKMLVEPLLTPDTNDTQHRTRGNVFSACTTITHIVNTDPSNRFHEQHPKTDAPSGDTFMLRTPKLWTPRRIRKYPAQPTRLYRNKQA